MEKWWGERRAYTRGGIIATAIWLTLVALYCFANKGNKTFLGMDLNEFGDFCAGVFAPLAFLWLIVGYAQQAEELSKNVEALKQQSAETANLVAQAQAQADAIKANELHARKDTFFRYADLLLVEQNSIVARIMGRVCDFNTDSLWERFGDGNRDALFNFFVREVIVKFENVSRHKFLLGDRKFVFEKNADRFIRNFEILNRKAAECDPDKSIREVFETGAMGRAYKGLCLVMGRTQILTCSDAFSSLDELKS